MKARTSGSVKRLIPTKSSPGQKQRAHPKIVKSPVAATIVKKGAPPPATVAPPRAVVVKRHSPSHLRATSYMHSNGFLAPLCTDEYRKNFNKIVRSYVTNTFGDNVDSIPTLASTTVAAAFEDPEAFYEWFSHSENFVHLPRFAVLWAAYADRTKFASAELFQSTSCLLDMSEEDLMCRLTVRLDEAFCPFPADLSLTAGGVQRYVLDGTPIDAVVSPSDSISLHYTMSLGNSAVRMVCWDRDCVRAFDAEDGEIFSRIASDLAVLANENVIPSFNFRVVLDENVQTIVESPHLRILDLGKLYALKGGLAGFSASSLLTAVEIGRMARMYFSNRNIFSRTFANFNNVTPALRPAACAVVAGMLFNFPAMTEVATHPKFGDGMAFNSVSMYAGFLLDVVDDKFDSKYFPAGLRECADYYALLMDINEGRGEREFVLVACPALTKLIDSFKGMPMSTPLVYSCAVAVPETVSMTFHLKGTTVDRRQGYISGPLDQVEWPDLSEPATTTRL